MRSSILHARRRLLPVLLLAVAGVWIPTAPGREPTRPATSGPRLTVYPPALHLLDSRSRQQLQVTSFDVEGYLSDVTRQATFEAADPNIVQVEAAGIVRPRRAGTTRVRVQCLGQTVEVAVTVGDLARSRPVSFSNEIMSVLGKAGCNAGTCHGHNSGKGGFKLSLRGYDPAADHKALMQRLDREDPDASTILLKATGKIAHKGGKRFDVGTDFYAVLRQWLGEKATTDVGKAVRLTRIEVAPDQLTMPRSELRQQLVVRAHYVDGSVRDVTHEAIYEMSTEGVIEVSPEGSVIGKREGEAAVVVRFLGQMGLARFTVIRHKPDFAWNSPPVHNFVDGHVYTKLKAIQVLPSALSSDAEFLRRAWIDAVGLPPDPDEVRAFLADKRPDKRARKIDELLDSEGFGDVWAAYWLELSGTTTSGDSAATKGVWTLWWWLRDTINRNRPYDRFVRALVAGKGSSLQNPGVTYSVNTLAKVEVVPQLFLGIRFECAQCHDHPFDVWKQEDYRGLVQFFTAGLTSKEGPGDTRGREISRFIPPEKYLPWEKDRKVTLRLPDGSPVEVSVLRDRRDVVVDWMFGPARKTTARAIVNRVWAKLFGRGIVDPVDDMRFSNPPVNEPLLAALAEDFIAHKYDFKHLVRTILNSRVYQLSSVPNATNTRETMNFSRSRLRRLSAEQLLDAIVHATGVGEQYYLAALGMRAIQQPDQYTSSRFLAMFGRPEQRMSACECIRAHDTTLPQILHLLNGDTVSKKLRAEGGTLTELLAKKPDHDRLVEELYLRVLCRLPDVRERRLSREFLLGDKDRAQAAEDLMWALITSQEFLFNH